MMLARSRARERAQVTLLAAIVLVWSVALVASAHAFDRPDRHPGDRCRKASHPWRDCSSDNHAVASGLVPHPSLGPARTRHQRCHVYRIEYEFHHPPADGVPASLRPFHGCTRWSRDHGYHLRPRARVYDAFGPNPVPAAAGALVARVGEVLGRL